MPFLPALFSLGSAGGEVPILVGFLVGTHRHTSVDLRVSTKTKTTTPIRSRDSSFIGYGIILGEFLQDFAENSNCSRKITATMGKILVFFLSLWCIFK